MKKLLLFLTFICLSLHAGQATHISDLPKELHYMIFSQLTEADSLEEAANNIKSAMLTNTKWHDWLQDINFVDQLIET